MPDAATIGGLPLDSTDRLFLTVLALHRPAGLTTVISGALAARIHKPSPGTPGTGPSTSPPSPRRRTRPAPGCCSAWLAAVVAYCNSTSSARLAARYPASGGTYAYGRERLGDFWGYLAGWGSWSARPSPAPRWPGVGAYGARRAVASRRP